MLDRIKKYFMAFMYGMKAGDELLTSSEKDIDSASPIEQKVEKKTVLDDLLRGEVTQEVEELRYETFKAEELSNEFTYIGSGQAVKKNGDTTKKRKKFVQYNVHQEYGLQESLSMIENKNDSEKDDWKNRSIFKMTYKNECVKFRLENYVHMIRVDMTNKTYKTFLYFIDDNLARKNKPLVNFAKKTMGELDRLANEDNKKKILAYMEKNELCHELETLSFTTTNATNDVPNGIDYCFSKPKFGGITTEDGYVVILYTWKKFDGNVLLSEKFKSESAEKKFANKEARKGYTPNAMDLIQTNDPTEIRKRDNDNLTNWLTDEK